MCWARFRSGSTFCSPAPSSPGYLSRRLLAGILIGFACTIKPQFGLLLFWACCGESGPSVAAFWLRSCRSRWSRCFVTVSTPISGIWRYLVLSRHGESFFANNSVNGILNGYLSSTNNILWDPLGFTPLPSPHLRGNGGPPRFWPGGDRFFAADEPQDATQRCGSRGWRQSAP